MALTKKIIALVALLTLTPLAWGGDIVGLWQEYDGNTGKVEALIRIRMNADGVYEGVIEKVLVAIPQNPQQLCLRCTGALHNAPMLGLRLLSGMKRKDALTFEGGEILDPDVGKIYKCRIQLAADGKRMKVTGYLGWSWLGDSEVWTRAE